MHHHHSLISAKVFRVLAENLIRKLYFELLGLYGSCWHSIRWGTTSWL
jgi:hypothetical protein